MIATFDTESKQIKYEVNKEEISNADFKAAFIYDEIKSASEIIKKLAENNIGTRPFFYPMNKQPVFKNMGLFDGIECPVAEKMSEKDFIFLVG